MTGKNRIMIYRPKADGTYVVEFRTADGEVLAIEGLDRASRDRSPLEPAFESGAYAG